MAGGMRLVGDASPANVGVEAVGTRRHDDGVGDGGGAAGVVVLAGARQSWARRPSTWRMPLRILTASTDERLSNASERRFSMLGKTKVVCGRMSAYAYVCVCFWTVPQTRSSMSITGLAVLGEITCCLAARCQHMG